MEPFIFQTEVEEEMCSSPLKTSRDDEWDSVRPVKYLVIVRTEGGTGAIWLYGNMRYFHMIVVRRWVNDYGLGLEWYSVTKWSLISSALGFTC